MAAMKFISFIAINRVLIQDTMDNMSRYQTRISRKNKFINKKQKLKRDRKNNVNLEGIKLLEK